MSHRIPRQTGQPERGAAQRRPARHLASLVLLTGLISGVADAATLGQIYDMALASDAQYAAARAAAAAGRERREQGLAGLLPSISLSGNLRDTHERVNSSVGRRNYGSGVGAVTLTQPLLRGVNYYTYEQGELQAQLADQQLKLAEQELLLRVAKGYFDVLQAQDALGTVTAQKDAFAQQLAQAKRSFEVGLAPVTDMNEAQSRYDLTVAQEIAARNDIELKRRTLEKAINAPLPPLAVLDEQAPVEMLDASQRATLVDRAPEDSIQVQIGSTAEQVARREVSRQDAGHMPTVDFVTSYSSIQNGNYTTIGASSVRQGQVGIEVAFPLFQGGAVNSRVREAVANADRAQQELLNARRQATLDARQALLGVESGTALHRALRQALSSSETQVRSTRRGFEVGVRTRVDVLNAEQQLFATKRDLATSRYQTLVASLQLKAAAGVLTEADLRALDKLLK